MVKSALVLGAGPAGCIAASMLRQKDFDVTIVERSAQVGAGARTYWYGGHPFTFGPRHALTKDEKIWAWLNGRCPLRRTADHEFWSFVPEDGNFYTFPINTADIDLMPERGRIIDELETPHPETVANFEEYWIGAVGRTLYDKMIDRYTRKMWRLDDNRQLDTWRWSPKGTPIKTGPRAAWDEALSGYPIAADGYNSFFDMCVADCKIVQGDVAAFHKILKADIVVNTTSVDRLFGYGNGVLPYIGRDFLKIVLPIEFALPPHCYWIYEAANEPWTRVTEFKKLTGHVSPQTLLGVEIPSVNGAYYPMPTLEAQALARSYIEMMPENWYTIGRHGCYRYEVDIAVCIEQAMAVCERVDGGWDHPVPVERFR